MKEIFDILEEYHKIDFNERKAALATVVKVEGSSYRQPGARMLITDDGKLTGAISGGCLEGDALRKALLVIARGKAMLVTYDTTDEDDAKLGIGLGCSGIIHILIEPIDPNNPANPLQLLQTVVNSRQKAVLITLFSLPGSGDNQLGTCIVYGETGTVSGSVPDQIPWNMLAPYAQEALAHKRSLIKSLLQDGFELTVFFELMNPAVSLVIFGAGNDVMPLVNMAGLLAWQITVIDGRPSYASCRRFPGVQQVLVSEAERALSQIVIDEQTVFVLMTHNYNYDLAILRQLIMQKVSYIGVLGPKQKLDRMFQELLPENDLKKDYPDNLYGPVGLDIGADTSEEIALSVIAEIKAVLAGKSGKSLREKTGTIHPRTVEENIIRREPLVEYQHG